MRIKLRFEIKSPIIPVEYRKTILSFIKKSLIEYSEELSAKLFNQKDPIVKPYATSVALPGAKFDKESITLSSNDFSLIFSTNDYTYGIAIYNAFLNQKYKAFPLSMQNSMMLVSIATLPERLITTDSIKIKMLSPLCLRVHVKEGNTDKYYTFEDDEFEKTLRQITSQQMVSLNATIPMNIENLSLVPINAKKTLVKHYNQYIDSSIGTFTLSGHPMLLNQLYLGGIGSRRGAVFGLFDIL